jgi:hypothetical protein
MSSVYLFFFRFKKFPHCDFFRFKIFNVKT